MPRCDVCDRYFPTEEQLHGHIGRDHQTDVTEGWSR